MKHELIYINEYKITLDYSVEKNLKSFKEEVLDQLYTIHKNDGVIDLMFSGGMDGTFILRSLMELGIKPNIHTISFYEDETDYDSLLAKSQCKKYGFNDPTFFFMDRNKIIEHISDLVLLKDIMYPSLHCYYVDYFLSKHPITKFFCGMSCEYRLYDSSFIKFNIPPAFIKYYNPNRLYGFDSSKTFFSYINEPIFVQNYIKEKSFIKGYGEDLWYVRNLVYNNCYPDIDIQEKRSPNDSNIAKCFYDHIVPIIDKKVPAMSLMKPFVFDLQHYYEKKIQC